MSQTYVGLLRLAPGVPTPADVERARADGRTLPEVLQQKVRALPKHLPSTCKLIGAYTVGKPDLGSVMLVEAEGLGDLQAINSYYAGWFAIEWHPSQLVPRD